LKITFDIIETIIPDTIKGIRSIVLIIVDPTFILSMYKAKIIPNVTSKKQANEANRKVFLITTQNSSFVKRKI